ncbi:SPOR domain-containing protein [Altibacter sp. HG106]|uniref:SPOR domain-containing protein n=1 Tax=Altibacter sp. HG106 TaxID=3023937 RepID=UPI002350D806|nr:SPOR domain-containing protein [Altibacter sp. HG106]MDC7994672.1 SPOR domain-containing protein [Altibacter sp. HG106]
MRFQYTLNILLISILLVFSAETVLAQRATVTVQQDEKISELLTLKKELEKENKLSSNYTIQLYYGELGQANAIMRRYRARFGSWPASIEYETPNYKVWVGNFSERLEADRALMQIKEQFSSAFILKPNK